MGFTLAADPDRRDALKQELERILPLIVVRRTTQPFVQRSAEIMNKAQPRFALWLKQPRRGLGDAELARRGECYNVACFLSLQDAPVQTCAISVWPLISELVVHRSAVERA